MFASFAARSFLAGAAGLFLHLPLAYAQETPVAWQVAKTSGEVWVVSSSAKNVALTSETSLESGDSIRTGRTGRVLLRRGQETILISPNSIIGVPASQDAQHTKIIQQAGSIVLEVNKRDARTFEVETPYLVAAVKGTQFGVTVGPKGSDVKVQHGSVEVADVKSGKFALVLPGQSATVSNFGNAGLSLRGTGTLSPIQTGQPRGNSVGLIPVPRGGLVAPAALRNALNNRAPGGVAPAAIGSSRSNAMTIAAPIGQVRLDISTATKGLARDAGPPVAGRSSATIWNGEASNGSTAVAAQTNSNASPTSSNVASLAATVAPIVENRAAAVAGAIAATNASVATIGNSVQTSVGAGSGTSVNVSTSGPGTTNVSTGVSVISGNNGGGNGNGNSNGNNSGGNGNAGNGNSGNGRGLGIGIGSIISAIVNRAGNSGQGNGNGGNSNGNNGVGNGNGNGRLINVSNSGRGR